MEILTSDEIVDNGACVHGDTFEKYRKKKWITIDDEFIEMLRLLKSFMTNGYGEHRDFRNMGTDYEGRGKVFKYFISLKDLLNTKKAKITHKGSK